MILKLQEMTKDREDKMNGLWSEFQQILRNYSEKTQEKYAEYVEMRERDNADTKEIHQHYLEIAKATRDISLLKGKPLRFRYKFEIRNKSDYDILLTTFLRHSRNQIKRTSSSCESNKRISAAIEGKTKTFEIHNEW